MTFRRTTVGSNKGVRLATAGSNVTFRLATAGSNVTFRRTTAGSNAHDPVCSETAFWVCAPRGVVSRDGAVEPPVEVTHPVDGGRVPAGTNVLIAGPALTGKRSVEFAIVGGSASRTAVLVTTKASADRMRSWFEREVGSVDEWNLRVIDCVSRSTAFGSVRERPDVHFVSSPGDLTGIGIDLFGTYADWHAASVEDPRVGLTSLSTLLMYADLKQVYRFLYVVTGRLRSVGGVGAFTVDTNAGSHEAIDALRGLFDAVVEVRDEERRELRVRGGEFGPRSWTEF